MSAINVSEMMAELRSEWKFSLPNNEFKDKISTFLLNLNQYITDIRQKAKDIQGKEDIDIEQAENKAWSHADPEIFATTHSFSDTQREIFVKICSKLSKDDLFTAIHSNVRIFDTGKNGIQSQMIEGRFLDLYYIAPFISACMNEANIEKPLVFSCISTLYQEAALVAIGPINWGFRDIRSVAAHPATELLALINEVAGKEEAKKTIEETENYFKSLVEQNQQTTPKWS